MNNIKLAFMAGIFAFAFIALQQKPVVYIIGDSTVKNGTGTAENSLWGWGSVIQNEFDTTKVSIQNHAIGGRSSRTFINEGRWDKVLATLKKGDYVLIQFGHNDAGPLDDTARARGSIRGIGQESKVIFNPKLKRQEEVFTYGHYLRKYITDAKAKGAIPIICSPVARNSWKDGKVNGTDYATWAKEVAETEKAFFLPLNEIIRNKYEELGAEKVKLFFPTDHTHTNKLGAELNAELVAKGLKEIANCDIKQYLLP
ncbi:MAG: rhamnogalacturonan acetylesterase [Flavobacterium sp.]|nr:MAG: rhamnogalacturonan acetylesterase [Flavobacterium sp.]